MRQRFRISARFAQLLWLAAFISGCAAPAAVAEVKTEAATGGAELPPPPGVFQTDLLNPLDMPHTYIQDTCKYLRARWHPNSAAPGSVVMIVAVRDVYPAMPQDPRDVENGELRRLMRQLKEQGFEAINIGQFLPFIERNFQIPERSVLIVRDGNYSKADFDANFGTYWEEWKWPVVNGWISGENTPAEIWNDNILMESAGFVDHQAHGFLEDAYLTDDTSKVIIARELQGSLDAFAARYGKSPVAFVWPNGGFGQRPAEIARLLHYQLGFTLNARGPVAYNWIPLADQLDPQRPGYLPEGALKDPLMTLPRYDPKQALAALDSIRVIGREAKRYALESRAAELEYYQAVCETAYGVIPAPPK